MKALVIMTREENERKSIRKRNGNTQMKKKMKPMNGISELRLKV